MTLNILSRRTKLSTPGAGPGSRRRTRLRGWLAFAVTMLATVGTVSVASPAAAGTSFFPAVQLSTGSGNGVNVKAGVYLHDYSDYSWTRTYARSYGSQNHRVDFRLVVNGVTAVHYYHPNVGTGTWEDCLNGTNTNCPGYRTGNPVYLRVTVRNLSTNVCRASNLSGAAMNTHGRWGTVHAC